MSAHFPSYQRLCETNHAAPVRFLVDNALSPVIARGLSGAGYDARHVLDYGMEAASDVEIMDRAVAEGRIVVSADTDFGTLLALPQRDSPSVILFRRGADRQPSFQLALLLANLESIRESLEIGALVIFEQTRIRVRRLPFGQS